MSFLHPSYLWALLGVAVPIAIHLWSKKEAKTIKIGSVQLLSESKSKQSSSIQLNEWWLLLLRMFIIGLIVLALAKPQWKSRSKNIAMTYIVEPSLIENAILKSVLDSLSQQSDIRLLQRGFPSWDATSKEDYDQLIPNYWQLATEMDALQTDSILVFTNGYLGGIRGMRPKTMHHINWVVIDSGKTTTKPLVAFKAQERLQLFSASSQTNLITVKKENVYINNTTVSLNAEKDSLLVALNDKDYNVPIINEEPVTVSLFYSDSLSNDKAYIEAALAALSSYLDKEIKVVTLTDDKEVDNQKASLNVWLSTKSIPIRTNKLLVFKKDTLARSLIKPSALPNTYELTRRITAENAVSGRLTEQLLRILELNKEVRPLLAKNDQRKVSEDELVTNHTADQGKKQQWASLDLGVYLWPILFVMLLLERIVAYKRKQ